MSSDAATDYALAKVRLKDAYAALIAALDACEDPYEAYALVTEAGDLLRALAEDIAHQRALSVRRIYAAEELTLLELGDRLSMSKGRADQLLKAAEKTGA